SPDGLRLYFTSDRGVGASIDIYVATRTSPTAAFGTPGAITELDSPQNERDMTLSHDELEIFIASDRSGDFEIYRSSRPDLTTPFSPPLPVAELDTANDELGPTLSADGATVYFNYNTNSQGGANSELFFATRPCLAR
ncbi:MAG TPA: hypothetical protein VLB44_16120, partial [Kofleriaceae bacterium]|nr:hypothetical protein [Kofleriaceae bacterium]